MVVTRSKSRQELVTLVSELQSELSALKDENVAMKVEVTQLRREINGEKVPDFTCPTEGQLDRGGEHRPVRMSSNSRIEERRRRRKAWVDEKRKRRKERNKERRKRKRKWRNERWQEALRTLGNRVTRSQSATNTAILASEKESVDNSAELSRKGQLEIPLKVEDELCANIKKEPQFEPETLPTNDQFTELNEPQLQIKTNEVLTKEENTHSTRLPFEYSLLLAKCEVAVAHINDNMSIKNRKVDETQFGSQYKIKVRVICSGNLDEQSFIIVMKNLPHAVNSRKQKVGLIVRNDFDFHHAQPGEKYFDVFVVSIVTFFRKVNSAEKDKFLSAFDLFGIDESLKDEIRTDVFYDPNQPPRHHFVFLDTSKPGSLLDFINYSTIALTGQNSLVIYPIGTSNLTGEQLCENVAHSLVQLSEQLNGKWDDLRSVELKVSRSFMLNIYSADTRDNSAIFPHVREEKVEEKYENLKHEVETAGVYCAKITNIVNSG